MHKIALILSTALMCGCGPLKSVQAESHTTVAISDSLLVDLIREELLRTTLHIEQTLVEYYPPASPVDTLGRNSVATTVATPQPPPSGPVKRIVRTEVTSGAESYAHSDSLSFSRINAAARNDERSTLEESPNTSGSRWLSWAAACLLLILLILIILKYKK